MRTLKFRVFDGVDHMSKPFTLEDLQATKVQFTRDTVVMQFTGLLDKSGVEIYEGDILAGNWVVVWHEAGFYLHLPEIFENTLYMPMAVKQQSEVIGNIYENPELLK